MGRDVPASATPAETVDTTFPRWTTTITPGGPPGARTRARTARPRVQAALWHRVDAPAPTGVPVASTPTAMAIVTTAASPLLVMRPMPDILVIPVTVRRSGGGSGGDQTGHRWYGDPAGQFQRTVTVPADGSVAEVTAGSPPLSLSATDWPGARTTGVSPGP